MLDIKHECGRALILNITKATCAFLRTYFTPRKANLILQATGLNATLQREGVLGNIQLTSGNCSGTTKLDGMLKASNQTPGSLLMSSCTGKPKVMYSSGVVQPKS